MYKQNRHRRQNVEIIKRLFLKHGADRITATRTIKQWTFAFGNLAGFDVPLICATSAHRLLDLRFMSGLRGSSILKLTNTIYLAFIILVKSKKIK